jgi:hypothetical protein
VVTDTCLRRMSHARLGAWLQKQRMQLDAQPGPRVLAIPRLAGYNRERFRRMLAKGEIESRRRIVGIVAVARRLKLVAVSRTRRDSRRQPRQRRTRRGSRARSPGRLDDDPPLSSGLAPAADRGGVFVPARGAR